MDQNEALLEAPTAPLTKWKNQPKLKDLKQDLQDAKPIHDVQQDKVKTWLDNMHVTGKAKPNTGTNRSAVQPKLIRKQAEWRYPALSDPFLSTDDVFNVRPVSWEDREAAKQNEVLLNHQFNIHLNKIAFIDEYVRTCTDEGTVIVRTGWEFKEEEYEDDFPIVEYQVNPAIAPQHEELARMREESPSEYEFDVLSLIHI